MMVDNDSATILNIDVKPGNAEDTHLEESFIQEPISNNNLKPKEAALDRGFDSYQVRKLFKEQKIKAAIPIKSNRLDKADIYKKDAFKIDLKNKKIICPANKRLRYMGFDAKRLTHEFIATDCCNCKLKSTTLLKCVITVKG